MDGELSRGTKPLVGGVRKRLCSLWVRAHEALDYARQVETLERRNFELGNSTILIGQLREQATVDAALLEVETLFQYFAALADYRAALALPDPGSDGR